MLPLSLAICERAPRYTSSPDYFTHPCRRDTIVARIMGREVWQGQSHEQLRDALGVPVDTDEKVMKKHRREIWKYHQTGVNRFGLRVTLEDGIVVGWDQKM